MTPNTFQSNVVDDHDSSLGNLDNADSNLALLDKPAVAPAWDPASQVAQEITPPYVVGIAPRFPEPLASSRWWTTPVRAERLAALRIAIGAAIVFDVLCSYWPQRAALFGAGSLGSAEVFAGRFRAPFWNWSLFHGVEQPAVFSVALIVWGVAALCLTLGVRSRAAAVVVWAIGLSLLNVNYYAHNAGDRLRQVALLYLMLSPCGAVWSLDALFARQRQRSLAGNAGPTFVRPWPLRLLFIHLAVMYCVSGLAKLEGHTWQSGAAIELTMTNVAWTRWSYAALPTPAWLMAAATWLTLIWEIGFPIWIAWRPTRRWAWLLGVGFHLGTGILLKLGMFPIYALCCYVPLLPWERLADRWRVNRPSMTRSAA